VAADESPRADKKKREPAPPPADARPPLTPERRDVPPSIRNVSFKVAVRGYDRAEVDAYVRQVNRVIAELEVSSSPRAAVRHALERVGEQVHGILDRARDTADEIVATARQEAEEIAARAKAEAADLVVNASTQADASRTEAAQILSEANAKADEIVARAKGDAEGIVAEARSEAEAHLRHVEEEANAQREKAQAQLREIQADIATVSEEHHGLLGDVRDLAVRLEQLAAEAAGKFEAIESTEPAEDERTHDTSTIPAEQDASP
jgi:DivIVA domain-containing protein